MTLPDNEPRDRRIEDERGWHLKKEVNLSIIISIAMVAGMCITGYADLKRDIALIKADTLVLHQRDLKMESDSKEALKVLQEAILRMDLKLDRLIERAQK